MRMPICHEEIINVQKTVVNKKAKEYKYSLAFLPCLKWMLTLWPLDFPLANIVYFIFLSLQATKLKWLQKVPSKYSLKSRSAPGRIRTYIIPFARGEPYPVRSQGRSQKKSPKICNEFWGIKILLVKFKWWSLSCQIMQWSLILMILQLKSHI